MWNYTCVTRQQFETIKDKVESFIVLLGGKKVEVALPPNNTTVQPSFEYNQQYYRVGQVRFPDKPFLVIECGRYDELINNIMEDIEPFPYDLSDDELLNEVKYALGIEPYPKDY